MKKCCKNCKYSYEKSGILGSLQCRRYPPTIFARGGIMTAFNIETKCPKVEEENWCGEFEPKNEE